MKLVAQRGDAPAKMIELGVRRRDDEASRAMGATMKLSARRHDDEAWRAMGATIKLSARRRDDEDMRDGKTTHPQRWEGGEHPRPKASRRRDPTQHPPIKDDGEKELLPPDCEEEGQLVPTATRWDGGEHPRPKASRRRDPTQRPSSKDDGEKELLPPDHEEEGQPVPTATPVLRVPCSGGGDCDEAACALLERTNRR